MNDSAVGYHELEGVVGGEDAGIYSGAYEYAAVCEDGHVFEGLPAQFIEEVAYALV